MGQREKEAEEARKAEEEAQRAAEQALKEAEKNARDTAFGAIPYATPTSEAGDALIDYLRSEIESDPARKQKLKDSAKEKIAKAALDLGLEVALPKKAADAKLVYDAYKADKNVKNAKEQLKDAGGCP